MKTQDWILLGLVKFPKLLKYQLLMFINFEQYISNRMIVLLQQLRVCSGHFHGGKKNEGDIPVADPEVDPPVHVDLPPAPPKRTEKVPKARRTVIEKLRKNASSSSSGAVLHGDNRTPYSDCEFDPGIVKGEPMNLRVYTDLIEI